MQINSIYKLMLAPLLLTQARKMRRTALRLPEAAGERTGVIVSEVDPTELKILFVGDSTMAGVGVQHLSAALPPQVASILSQRLSRSIRWQLVAKPGIDTNQALAFATGQNLFPADILVTALGVNDVASQRTPRQFIADYEALIAALSASAGAHFIVISGLPPLHIAPAAPQPLRWYLGRCAHLLDEHLRRWASSRPDVAYVSLQWGTNPKEMAADGYHPGETLYKKWAILIAESIVNSLSDQGQPVPRNRRNSPSRPEQH